MDYGQLSECEKSGIRDSLYKKFSDYFWEHESKFIGRMIEPAVFDGSNVNQIRILWLPFFDWEYREYKDFIVKTRRDDPDFPSKITEPVDSRSLRDKIFKPDRMRLLWDFGYLKSLTVEDEPERGIGKRVLWFPLVDQQFEKHKDFIINERKKDLGYLGQGYTPEPNAVQQLLESEYPDRVDCFDNYATHLKLKRMTKRAQFAGEDDCFWGEIRKIKSQSR